MANSLSLMRSLGTEEDESVVNSPNLQLVWSLGDNNDEVRATIDGDSDTHGGPELQEQNLYHKP